MDKTVIELFAGVGGFRVGLNNIKEIGSDGKAVEHGDFKFVWANQWEPSTKAQHAYDCYHMRFGDGPDSNQDISMVDKSSIPDHALLCGGFPCQDYSVAHSLTTEKGIEGKKGVLWWQIRDILVAKKPPFVLLENVDRLLKSPAKQRGRDFGIMLRCMADLGYIVEWRVINAAEYGFPQRRRRIFIFASRDTTKYSQYLKSIQPFDVLNDEGIFARQFPVEPITDEIKRHDLTEIEDLVEFSNEYRYNFENTGMMINGVVYTIRTFPVKEKPTTIGQISQSDVDEHYYLDDKQKEQFEKLRGSKKIERTKPDGTPYLYSEGAMSPYDVPDLPGRTMLTSEGSVNRSTHIIKDPSSDRLRILTPIECERLNMFPDNWTDSGMGEKRRYFMMGNALVTGIISRLGDRISKIIDDEEIKAFPEDHRFVKTELKKKLDGIVGKTLGEVDAKDVFKRAETKPKITGIAGDVIEQSVLGYKADTRKEHDILVDGTPTEVKTTGFRVNKKNSEYNAKEPMSITAVSPNEIVNESFETSHFWDKLEHMLLVYYHYDSDKTVKAIDYKDFFIKGYEFHEFSLEEKRVLERDWTIVRDFIAALQRDYKKPEEEYPRISHDLRPKLMLIDTAPKWPNPPRFRLKRSFVDEIIKSHFHSENASPIPITGFEELDAACDHIVKAYGGKTVSQLMGIMGVEGPATDKAISERLMARLFDPGAKKMSEIPLFVKAGIHCKTITLSSKGGRTEDMKLCDVNFDELSDPNCHFEDSSVCDYFSQSQFLCAVFKEKDGKGALGENTFIGFKRVAFPDEFLEDEVKRSWDEAHSLIITGKFEKVLEFFEDGTPKINKNGVQRSHTNFPKSKDHIIFMRGTGGDSADTPINLNGFWIYRFQFWIKGSYIVELVTGEGNTKSEMTLDSFST